MSKTGNGNGLSALVQRNQPSGKLHRWLYDLLMIGMIASLSGCGNSGGAEKAAAPAAAAAQPPALVRVSEVKREQISPSIVAIGTVRSPKESVVASGAEGVVHEFGISSDSPSQPGSSVIRRLEKGEFVEEGQELCWLRMEATELDLEEQRAILRERQAELDQIEKPRREDVEEARARLMVAEANLKNSQRRTDEMRGLVKNSAIGASEAMDAEDALLAATQTMAAAKAVYERVESGAREEEKLQAKARRDAQAKHVEFLEAERAKRITKAPFSGVVVETHTNPGQWLSKGSPIITLVDLSEVDVEIQVDQSLIGQVAPGKKVRLAIKGATAAESPDGQWSGTVENVVPRSAWESGSRSFPVTIRVANTVQELPGKRLYALQEGMMAEATFDGSPVDAVMVPKDALVRTSRGNFVFVVNPAIDGEPLSVRRVVVELGVSLEGRIEIIGKGIEQGMQVVREGGERLQDFHSVQVLPDQEAAVAE